jgi:hypothetical protein
MGSWEEEKGLGKKGGQVRSDAKGLQIYTEQITSSGLRYKTFRWRWTVVGRQGSGNLERGAVGHTNTTGRESQDGLG